MGNVCPRLKICINEMVDDVMDQMDENADDLNDTVRIISISFY